VSALFSSRAGKKKLAGLQGDGGREPGEYPVTKVAGS